MLRKWVPPSLRTWLFLLALSAMLPVSLFTASTMVEVENGRRQATLSHLNQRVDLVAHQLDDMILASVSALNALGQTAAARTGDFATLHESARHVLRTNPAFRAVTMIDAQGKMLFATPLPYGSALFPTSQPELVREAFETGKPNLSGPFVTPISANQLVAVSVPMRHDGRITHVLRMVILASSISDLLIQDPLPAG